jgi:3-isopropylmalate/(R)-2-methylmalate dehydratase large subunit
MDDPVLDLIARKGKLARVNAGDIVEIDVDRVYIQDGNAPTVARLFTEHGFDRVFDPDRIGIFVDHAVLAPDLLMRDRIKEAERFARQFGLRFFPGGTGISHLVAFEQGWFAEGTVVVGADSHTCTGGAAGALAFGLGASDVVAALVTGRTWLRVPEVIEVHVVGRPLDYIRPRDVAYRVLAAHGQRPFLGRSLVWSGAWIEELDAEDAAGLANLTVELGAFCCRMARSAAARPVGASSVAIDVGGIEPTVSRPPSPDRAVPLSEAAGIRIDEVFIGSCASSRFKDITVAASIFAGRRVAQGIQCVVTPGTQNVYARALDAGCIKALVSAGVLVTPAGCGSCVGTQGPVPASGSTVLSTMNRNFKGRMGNPDAEIWLASPAVAAASAVIGRIPTVAELESLLHARSV